MTQISILRRKFKTYFSSSSSMPISSSDAGGSYANSYSSSRKLKKYFKKQSVLPYALALLVIIAIVIFAVRAMNAARYKQTTAVTAATLALPTATVTLNKSFNFPLNDQSGKVISMFTYSIQNAALQNQIIIQGQTASAVQGTSFLILSLKITNNFTKSFSVNARDYVRLIVNNASDKLAPVVYNDPVQVQAISTDYTRVGFTVKSTDKNFKLQVGQITGKKQLIDINF